MDAIGYLKVGIFFAFILVVLIGAIGKKLFGWGMKPSQPQQQIKR
jgi:hypothetical protein